MLDIIVLMLGGIVPHSILMILYVHISFEYIYKQQSVADTGIQKGGGGANSMRVQFKATSINCAKPRQGGGVSGEKLK